MFQFTDPGEYWMDVGAELKYEFAHEDGAADELAAILLLQKDWNRITAIANAKFEWEVGEHRSGGTAFKPAIGARYRWLPYLEPGVEWHSDFGNLHDMGSFAEQKHRVGPVIYGNLGHGFKYEAGYLVGVSRESEDGSAKFMLEYEIPL